MAYVKIANIRGGKGDKGDAGAAAVLAAAAASTLPPGSVATAAMSGPQAARVLTVGVPQGERGPRGLPGAEELPTDEAVAEYASAEESQTGMALRATFLSVDKSPINVLQAGASPSKSAAENTAILNAVMVAAVAQGRSVYFPGVVAPIKINDAITVDGTVPMIYGDGRTSVIEQTVWPKPIFDLLTSNDVTVQGIRGVNSTTRVQTGFMTPFRGNTAKNYSAFVYANGDNISVRDCSSHNLNAGVFCLGTAVARNRNITVENFEVTSAEFGVFVDYCDGVVLRNIQGSYSFSVGGSQAPHLLYIGAFADSNITGLIVDGCRAKNGRGGSAYQFKDIIGGSIRNLLADDCDGILSFMYLVDTTIDGVTSLNDAWSAVNSATDASLQQGSTDPLIRTTIRNVRMQMVHDARAIRLLAAERCKLEDVTIEVAHTSTSNVKYDIEVAGGWEVNRPRVINSGPNAWDQIYILTGAGSVIRDPETRGGRIPVRVSGSATGARIIYDPEKLGLHTTDGKHRVDMNEVVNGNKAVQVPSARTRHGSRNLGEATFLTAAGSASAPGVIDTGQLLTTAAGLWVVENGTVRNTQAAVGVLWADFGQADVEVACDLLYRDANGIAFRGIDVGNYLHVRIRAGIGVELRKRDAAVDSDLAVVALTPTPVNDRRYRLGVRVFGSEVKVLLDGVVVISHTLSAGDATKFGAGTLHGLRSHTDTACRFTDLVVNSLR